MALSEKIKKDIREKKQKKAESVEYFKEEILVTDALKEPYDEAVKSIDSDLLNDINSVNNLLIEVQSAYQARIDFGCRTDLFWSVNGYDTVNGYTLTVTKLPAAGYGTTLTVLNTSGGISSYASDIIEIPGIESQNLHAIKYYNEPYTKDIGDTTIGSFIGVIGVASTVLSIVSQSSEELISAFDVGNLIISSKDNVFSSFDNKIVGFGTTTITGVSTSVMEQLVGVSTDSLDTSTIILESATIGFSSITENNQFTVVTDPSTFQSMQSSSFKYRIKFTKNPYSPQTIGIMDTGNLGIGTYIEYDNSGLPSATQSWKPYLKGVVKKGVKVKEPIVGSGKIYNIVGFSSVPSFLGVPQPEGTTIITNILIDLYTAITPPSGCTQIENNLTNLINLKNTAEANLSSNSNCIQNKVDAANALRKERDEYSLKIWTLRQTIGHEFDRMDDYDALQTYIEQTQSSIDGTSSCL